MEPWKDRRLRLAPSQARRGAAPSLKFRLWIDDVVANRKPYHFGHSGHVKLAHHVGAMCLDRPQRDCQVISDFFAPLTFRKQLQDHPLATGQDGAVICRAAGLWFRQQQRHCFTQERLVVEKRLDRGNQLLDPVGFSNVTMSTGVEGIAYICLGGASGKDQDLGVWGEIADFRCCQKRR